MGDQFKLEPDGTCQSCKVITCTLENIQCFTCKGFFHCACPGMVSDDDKVGTKSLVTAFNRPSTQNNFKSFCDCCLTKLEIDTANTDSSRLNTVEVSITTIKSEMEEIKNLLLKEKSPTAKQEKSKPSYTSNGDNTWFN